MVDARPSEAIVNVTLVCTKLLEAIVVSLAIVVADDAVTSSGVSSTSAFDISGDKVLVKTAG